MKKVDVIKYNESLDPKISSYASVSSESYLNSIKTNNWITDSKYDITYALNYVDEEKTILRIDFQCTASDKDWEVNLNFFVRKINYNIPKKPYKQSKLWFAHGGFVKAYKSINDNIINEFYSNPNINTIIIRGYSQGAAYTVLCTEDIKYHIEASGRNVKVYSIAYAPPRVIFLPFSWNVYKRIKDIILVKTFGDPVTHAPPLLFLFKHFGKKFKMGKWYMDILPFFYKKHYANSYSSLLKENVNK